MKISKHAHYVRETVTLTLLPYNELGKGWEKRINVRKVTATFHFYAKIDKPLDHEFG